MASAVDICNLALAHIGDEATVSSISPPEGSTQAEHCARFYPIARDALLEMHAWRFAIRRISLAEVTNTLDSWGYAYSLPTAVLKPLAVLQPEVTDDTKTQPFIVETDSVNNQVVYTNVEDATLRYIVRVTDTTKFSPLFVVSLSWLLASYLAGPVLKGKTGASVKRACLEQFRLEYGMAAVADGKSEQTQDYKNHRPAWIGNR